MHAVFSTRHDIVCPEKRRAGMHQENMFLPTCGKGRDVDVINPSLTIHPFVAGINRRQCDPSLDVSLERGAVGMHQDCLIHHQYDHRVGSLFEPDGRICKLLGPRGTK